MGNWIKIRAADGFELSAYRDGPENAAHCLVVGQEVFGVNRHMRYACAQLATEGFAVIAPALLDRAERDVDLGYGTDDLQHGIELRARIPQAATLADLLAAREVFGARKVGVIGYCWGGRVAWWGATRSTRFDAAVAWYGGGLAADKDERPHCPVQMHFGEKDHSIPLSDVEAIRAAQPGVETFIYEGAAHGFGCEERPMFDPTAYALAQSRSVDFLRRHLG
ncbi:dienelactone hydrolase family protein [Rhodanobacter sp. Si-c]|uniref:Dienelactone hydrolase family protein n=1 Tax=Rhodanobacter lycopersici TaxID=3162487 RepID=A0ABV3QF11_9GAMM